MVEQTGAVDLENNAAKNVDFAFEVISRKLDMQNHAHNAIESKIGTLFGFVGALAGAAVVLLENKANLLGLNIFTIGMVGIYVTLIFLVLASRTRTFMDPPDFPVFYSAESLARQNVDLKNQAVSDMISSYKINMKHQVDKSRFYDLAVYCFAVSVLFLFLGILEVRK